MRVEMTNSRIPLLIVLSAVIGNPCAEALWAQTSTLSSSGNPHWVTDRDAEVRSNAVLYHSGGEDNVGSKLVVSSGSGSVAALMAHVKEGAWQGGPQDRRSFRREWLPGRLRLNKGMNELKLSVIPTARQREFAEADLQRPLTGWPKRSLHVFGIEIVRPAVLSKMRRDAPHLKSSTDWMVRGKYGIMIHWVPESYSLYGDTPAWKQYEQAVNPVRPEAFAEMVASIAYVWGGR